MFVPCAAVLFVALVAIASQGQAQSDATETSAVPQTPEWQKLGSLVGSWEGTFVEDGKSMPATADVRLTGNGSAIMHVMGRDTPYEMVTKIHPDGKRLVATHCCADHNQPRMALVASPNQVAFTFVNGTNIRPGETHMEGVAFTFVDADHHEEAWSNSGGGTPTVFEFARKK